MVDAGSLGAGPGGLMQMVSQVDLDRPAAEVFDYIANFENNPRWQGGMQRAAFTSEPPLRVGSTYEQLARFLGREIRTTFTVTALEPGRSISIESVQSTFPIQVTRSVEPLDDGRCRVTARVSGQVTGWFRLIGPLMRPMAKRSIDRDYANLKRVLEGEQGPPDP